MQMAKPIPAKEHDHANVSSTFHFGAVADI